MSLAAITSVLEYSEARGSARVVMFVLAEHADEYGFCRPGVARLSHMARINERNVQRHFKTLQDIGELEILYRLRQASVYRIVLPGIRAVDREQLERLAEWGIEGLRVAKPSPEPKALTKDLKHLSKTLSPFAVLGSGDGSDGGWRNRHPQTAVQYS